MIYSFPSPSDRFQPKLRSVLLQTTPILHARWNPVRTGSLVLCCGGGGMYSWSNEWANDAEPGSEEEIAECIGVPASKSLHVFLMLFTSVLISSANSSQRNFS